MYPYMTLADETEIVHSQIIDVDGIKKVIVHFNALRNRALIQPGVSFRIINGSWILLDGYSDDEIRMFEQLLQSNAHLVYKYAENGGIQIANAKCHKNMVDEKWRLHSGK